jgi:hypothetical protein
LSLSHFEIIIKSRTLLCALCGELVVIMIVAGQDVPTRTRINVGEREREEWRRSSKVCGTTRIKRCKKECTHSSMLLSLLLLLTLPDNGDKLTSLIIALIICHLLAAKEL